jgi:hypothetical protein
MCLRTAHTRRQKKRHRRYDADHRELLPDATTLFVLYPPRHANSPRSLTDFQVYAVTAYILAQNQLIDPKQVIDVRTATAS